MMQAESSCRKSTVFQTKGALLGKIEKTLNIAVANSASPALETTIIPLAIDPAHTLQPAINPTKTQILDDMAWYRYYVHGGHSMTTDVWPWSETLNDRFLIFSVFSNQTNWSLFGSSFVDFGDYCDDELVPVEKHRYRLQLSWTDGIFKIFSVDHDALFEYPLTPIISIEKVQLISDAGCNWMVYDNNTSGSCNMGVCHKRMDVSLQFESDPSRYWNSVITRKQTNIPSYVVGHTFFNLYH